MSRSLGLLVLRAAAEDIIVILLRCPFLVILRRVGKTYILVGEAYVDRLMNGEAIAGL